MIFSAASAGEELRVAGDRGGGHYAFFPSSVNII